MRDIPWRGLRTGSGGVDAGMADGGPDSRYNC
jgi:hypothetical protein